MTATLDPTIDLPPSASVVEISGREYIIAPFDEFKAWEESRKRGDGKSPIADLRGEGKGMWMADDFNAPMEEFAEYM